MGRLKNMLPDRVARLNRWQARQTHPSQYEGVPPADHVSGNRKERRAIAAVKRRIKNLRMKWKKTTHFGCDEYTAQGRKGTWTVNPDPWKPQLWTVHLNPTDLDDGLGGYWATTCKTAEEAMEEAMHRDLPELFRGDEYDEATTWH